MCFPIDVFLALEQRPQSPATASELPRLKWTLYAVPLSMTCVWIDFLAKGARPYKGFVSARRILWEWVPPVGAVCIMRAYS